MVMKPTVAYKHLRVSYLIHILCLLHVSAKTVAILRVLHYDGYMKKGFGSLHKFYCTPSYFKARMYVLYLPIGPFIIII
jgi:hypothetical protein